MKIYLKFTLCLLIVLFQVNFTKAKSAAPNWQLGKIVLWDRRVLEGSVSYNWLMEIVLFRREDGRIHTYSVKHVSQFGWFDFSGNRFRDFRALDSQLKQTSSQSFFEVCMDGPLVVVRRLKQPGGLAKHLAVHPTRFTDQPSLSQNMDSFDYFVYDAGRLRPMDRFYPDIYQPLMTAYSKQLQGYIHSHNINDRSLMGRLVLIDRYNSLVAQDAKTASIKAIGSTPE